VSITSGARTVARSQRPNTSVGSTPLYKAEVGMTTSSGKFVGIDVAKDKLDIAVLEEKKAARFVGPFLICCLLGCATLKPSSSFRTCY
jgi:hypothetical protein